MPSKKFKIEKNSFDNIDYAKLISLWHDAVEYYPGCISKTDNNTLVAKLSHLKDIKYTYPFYSPDSHKELLIEIIDILKKQATHIHYIFSKRKNLPVIALLNRIIHDLTEFKTPSFETSPHLIDTSPLFPEILKDSAGKFTLSEVEYKEYTKEINAEAIDVNQDRLSEIKEENTCLDEWLNSLPDRTDKDGLIDLKIEAKSTDSLQAEVKHQAAHEPSSADTKATNAQTMIRPDLDLDTIYKRWRTQSCTWRPRTETTRAIDHMLYQAMHDLLQTKTKLLLEIYDTIALWKLEHSNKTSSRQAAIEELENTVLDHLDKYEVVSIQLENNNTTRLSYQATLHKHERIQGQAIPRSDAKNHKLFGQYWQKITPYTLRTFFFGRPEIFKAIDIAIKKIIYIESGQHHILSTLQIIEEWQSKKGPKSSQEIRDAVSNIQHKLIERLKSLGYSDDALERQCYVVDIGNKTVSGQFMRQAYYKTMMDRQAAILAASGRSSIASSTSSPNPASVPRKP